jgi:hypothetical protein
VRFRRGPRALEDAIARVAVEDTRENREALYKRLLKTEVYVATPEAPEQETTRVTEEGETLPVVLVDSDDGPVLPVFTQVDRMLEWRPEGSGYIATAGRTVFRIAEMNRVVRILVNPASPTCGALERPEIEALARGRIPIPGGEAMQSGTTLRVGTAARPPADDVLAAVREALATEGRAVRAWLFLFQEGGNPPEHAVAVEFEGTTDDAALENALRQIVQRAGDRCKGVRELMFVRFDAFLRDRVSDGMGKRIFERDAFS